MTGLQVENTIDLHCHFSPDHLGGKALEKGLDCRTGMSPVESAKEAIASGQTGAVLKSHSFATPALADALGRLFPDFRAFGGICTDYISGGLNIHAVEAALIMGAKIVWLPTLNSANDHAGANVCEFDGPGISLIDDDGRLIDAVHQIFALVREYNAILATGHISATEHYAVVREFDRRGKVIVTHAGEKGGGPNLSSDQCVELADLGAVIEFCAHACDDAFGRIGRTPLEIAERVHRAGAHRCVLSTDYGFMKEVPAPITGFRNFLERMWSEGGISEDDLAQMASRNPAELLNIEV